MSFVKHFWDLEAACVFTTGRIRSTASAAHLYAEVEFCTQLGSENLLYGIELRHNALAIRDVLKVWRHTVGAVL